MSYDKPTEGTANRKVTLQCDFAVQCLMMENNACSDTFSVLGRTESISEKERRSVVNLVATQTSDSLRALGPIYLYTQVSPLKTNMQ